MILVVVAEQIGLFCSKRYYIHLIVYIYVCILCSDGEPVTVAPSGKLWLYHVLLAWLETTTTSMCMSSHKQRLQGFLWLIMCS